MTPEQHKVKYKRKQTGINQLSLEKELAILKQTNWKSKEIVYLDGINITDKESFLKEIAPVLNFPDWFGYNWDSLIDCLREIAGKYEILYVNQEGFKKPLADYTLDSFENKQRWRDYTTAILLLSNYNHNTL